MENKPGKILCIGNICVDIKAYCPAEDDTEAYKDGTIEIVPGGVARGMALNLKLLGLDSAILSYVGDDIFGDYLRRTLEAKNIDTTLLHQSKERKTALFSVMKNGTRDATCIYNTNIIKEINFNKEVIDYIEKNNVTALTIDSNLTPEALEDLYTYKKDHPELFIFQNATAPDLAAKTVKYAPLIDLFGLNEYEAAAILGEEATPDLPTAEKFQSLGFKNFIMTFGSQGVMVRVGNETWIEPPYKPDHIIDTIGAGDAFASGFLMGFLEKDPVKRCIHYGLNCSKETLLTKQTVNDLLTREIIGKEI